MKSAAPLHLLRPWGEQWQLWKRSRASAPWALVKAGDLASLKPPPGTLCAVPARLVVAVPFWQKSAGGDAVLEMARLEIEMRGLPGGDRLEHDVAVDFLEDNAGQTLTLGKVFPQELPGLEKIEAASFEASPALLILSDRTLHLWRELDDLVAAIVWRGRLVCWETMHWTMDTREVEVWLGCLLRQLREELRLDSPLRLKEWTAIFKEAPGGLQRDPILHETEAKEGPAIATDFASQWRPLCARLAAQSRQQKVFVTQALATAAGFVLLLVSLAAFSLLRTQWKIRSTDAALAAAEREVSPILVAGARWNRMEAAVDQRVFPLEILHTVVQSMGSTGVRFTAFEISSDKVLVEGEAANVTAATEFYKTLQANSENETLSWEMPQPSLQANSSARFIINGERHDEANR